MAYRLPGSLADEQNTRRSSLDEMSPPAADVNYNGKRDYNIGAGQFTTDAAQLGQVLVPPIVTTNAPGATPTIALGAQPPTMTAYFTGLAANITSMTTNLTGTPVAGQLLTVAFLEGGTAHTIAWGASFTGGLSTVGLPGTTLINTLNVAKFIYLNSVFQLIDAWCDNSFVNGGTFGASPATVTPDTTHPTFVMIDMGASATAGIVCNGNQIYPSTTSVAKSSYAFRCPANASFTLTYSAGAPTYTTTRCP